MDRLLKALKIAFASEFSFYLKAHNFHWNVEGPDFFQYHDLFSKIYEEVFEAIDPFAEQIRAAGGYVPGSLQRFSMLTQIEDETKVPMPLDMVVELLEDSDKMAEIFRMCFQLSEQEGLHGLSDFLAGRQDAHKKHSWMLRATSK
jgi:starvation-inducible DNA-binding protein